MITLTPVRFHTANSPYHYSEDNKPLEDLEARDAALKAAIEAFDFTNQTLILGGDWTTLTGTIDLTVDINKPFAYKVTMWAIEDQSIGATHNSTFFEDVLVGFSSAVGVITLSNTFSHHAEKTGVPTLTRTYTPGTNLITLSFSGYTGTNAFVQARIERMGP